MARSPVVRTSSASSSSPPLPRARKPHHGTGWPRCRCMAPTTQRSPIANALCPSFLSSTLRAAPAYHDRVAPDMLVMLDGRPDVGGLPGGTGRQVPLEWAADVARHRRVILAGGLGPDDVGSGGRCRSSRGCRRLQLARTRARARKTRTWCVISLLAARSAAALPVVAMSAEASGRFDGYGGAYVPETLVPCARRARGGDGTVAFADAQFIGEARSMARGVRRQADTDHARAAPERTPAAARRSG